MSLVLGLLKLFAIFNNAENKEKNTVTSFEHMVKYCSYINVLCLNDLELIMILN